MISGVSDCAGNKRYHCVFYDAAVRGKDGKLGAYVFDFKLPSRSGVMIPVCENFFRTVLGYNRDDRQWRSALDRVKKAQVAKVQQTVSDIEAAEGGDVGRLTHYQSR